MSGINTNVGAFPMRNVGTAGTSSDKPQARPANSEAAGQPSFAAELKSVETSSQSAPANTDLAAQGLDSLINTNLETEAAKLQALQVQQQLGSQSVGIVNQRASTLLSLFNK